MGLAQGFCRFCRRWLWFWSGIRWSSRGHRLLIAIRGALGTLRTAACPARSSAHRVEWRIVRGVPAPDSLGTSRLRHWPRSLRGRPCGHRPHRLIPCKNWRDVSTVEGAACNVMVNEVIRAECHQVSFWKHKGLMNSQEPIFRTDGVHFNDLGSYKLFRSYRGAILRVAKWL